MTQRSAVGAGVVSVEGVLSSLVSISAALVSLKLAVSLAGGGAVSSSEQARAVHAKRAMRRVRRILLVFIGRKATTIPGVEQGSRCDVRAIVFRLMKPVRLWTFLAGFGPAWWQSNGPQCSDYFALPRRVDRGLNALCDADAGFVSNGVADLIV